MSITIKSSLKNICTFFEEYLLSKDRKDFKKIEKELSKLFSVEVVKIWATDVGEKNLSIESTQSKTIITLPILKDDLVIGVVKLWKKNLNGTEFSKKNETLLVAILPFFVNIIEEKDLEKDFFIKLLSHSSQNIEQSIESEPVSKSHHKIPENEKIIELEKRVEELLKENQEYEEKSLDQEELLLYYKSEINQFNSEKQKMYDERQKSLGHLEKTLQTIFEEKEAKSKELEKRKTLTEGLERKLSHRVEENLKLEGVNKSLFSKQNFSNLDNNMEFILQKADFKFGENENSYILFELLTYMLLSSQNISVLESKIIKTKIIEELLNDFYFNKIQLNDVSYRFSNLLKHIQNYQKIIFNNRLNIDISVDENIPVTLVFDAPKLVTVILHILFDLNVFIEKKERVHIAFSLINKTLLVEFNGVIKQQNSIIGSMFKKSGEFTIDEKSRKSLKISKELAKVLKGKLTNSYEKSLYNATLNIPIKMIKL